MSLSDQDIQFAQECIKKTGLFVGISDAELDQLSEGLEKQSYKPNTTVLFQGEISNRLYLVQTGTVAVWVRQAKDKVKVAELSTGAYFGEISLLTPTAATATIKAETETEVITLPGEVVEKLVKKNPVLAKTLNDKISERLASRKQALDKEKEK